MLHAEDIAALMGARHPDPCAVLGMQERDGQLWVHALLPGALGVDLLDRTNGRCVAGLQRLAGSEVFGVRLVRRRHRFDYLLRVQWPGPPGQVHPAPVLLEDPYRFGIVLGELDLWLLAEGTHRRPHQCLGAHPRDLQSVAGVSFAVWAPNAQRVSVVGPFNAWDGRRHPMRLRRESGIWELFVPGLGVGELYKFEIRTHSGELLLKADPFAFRSELRPGTASIVQGLPPVSPMRPEQAKANDFDQPISIYEVHLGSWRKADGWRWLTYRELADTLVPYARDMGFTHLELMPVSEHPFDGSWGYQPVGLYAPTARFGTPEDFRHFVDAAHAAGLGIILDWVPAHFPSDAHGLARFDGTALYEHADPREGFHQDWNTLIYNFGRTEVRNFLIGNALYWLEHFGIDGLRVDAVASMLYRDYSRGEGQWVANRHGGRENLEAIAFLRLMNHTVGVERPGAITLAEESTAFPGVSRPPSADLQGGGLGFHYKWNMGWMHDTLEYIQRDPAWRKYHHGEITFSMLYAYDEKFVLPISHDEVVHGKGSLLAKMPGDHWQKLANMRAYLAFMWTHPGKKLLFMGQEFAQPSEWSESRDLDWWLLDHHPHRGMQQLVSDMNKLYVENPSLWELDHEHDGFQWIDGGNADQNILSFLRFDAAGNPIAVVVNFAGHPYHNFRLGLPKPGTWKEIMNTDAEVYGGSGVGNSGGVQTEEHHSHGRPYSAEITVPPLGSVWLKLS